MIPLDPSRNLAYAVADAVTRGWRVESQTNYSAVLVAGQRPNHILHALLSFFTCGMWLPIWLVVAVSTREYRMVLTVDQWGNVRQG